MKYACALVSMLAVLVSACTSEEDRIKARVEALPELPSDIADQLDEKTMALRNPDLGAPFQPVMDTKPGTEAHLQPCCSIKITKSLKVLYQTTWCKNPFKDLVAATLADTKSQGDDGGSGDTGVTPPVRNNKLSTFKGKKLLRPFWCQTGSGPWDAQLVFDDGCTTGGYYSLVVSTPGGLVGFPPWTGGEENKPASVTVTECNLVGTTRASCGGLSSCDCSSSSCTTPGQCSCPLF